MTKQKEYRLIFHGVKTIKALNREEAKHKLFSMKHIVLDEKLVIEDKVEAMGYSMMINLGAIFSGLMWLAAIAGLLQLIFTVNKLPSGLKLIGLISTVALILMMPFALKTITRPFNNMRFKRY